MVARAALDREHADSRERVCRQRERSVSDKKSLHEQVTEFHRKYSHPVRETPGPISDERMRFRARLIAEEFFEVLEAIFTDEVACDGHAGHDLSSGACPSCGNKFHTLGLHTLEEGIRELIAKSTLKVNYPELFDGLGDLEYVTTGTRVECGIDGEPIAAEIHRSNMQKVPNGTSEPGKPPGWKPPDIEGEMKKQGWK